MLKPLSQFFCDTCNAIIRSPEKGCVGFQLDHEGLVTQCVIIHDRKACFPKVEVDFTCEPLSNYVGSVGIRNLIALMNPGPLLVDYKGLQIDPIAEWAEFARRLTLPYYEEARRYLDLARQDRLILSAASRDPYAPEVLATIVKTYGE
jgi:hypothetical protein